MTKNTDQFKLRTDKKEIILPGIVQSIKTEHKIKWNEKKAVVGSKVQRQFEKYNGRVISLELLFFSNGDDPEQDARKALSDMHAIFTKRGSDNAPVIYQTMHPQLIAVKIRHLVFENWNEGSKAGKPGSIKISVRLLEERTDQEKLESRIQTPPLQAPEENAEEAAKIAAIEQEEAAEKEWEKKFEGKSFIDTFGEAVIIATDAVNQSSNLEIPDS